MTVGLWTGPLHGQSYEERYRPQVHFSPAKNWTNDPNGLVFFKGEYHLFFQYNPFGDQWGHMSWGHAVSKDLLHWEELPVAIPEKDGEMVFTGSVVVDERNSSGLCEAGKACLVAVYTGFRGTAPATRQDQNLAYSRDDGRTWTRYAGNPVLDLHMADFRDPSVTWNAKRKEWLMAVSLPKEHKVRFYGSKDLKEWTQMSEFGPAGDVAGDWECPDLLRVPAAAKGGKEMWALKVGLNPGGLQGGSGEQYFLGSFDGRRFKEAGGPGARGWTNYGKDDYCAINFNGLGREEPPVLIGWMSNWQYADKTPTAPWRGQMSVARRLAVVRDADGLGLRQEPVVEAVRGTPLALGAGTVLMEGAAPMELDLNFSGAKGEAFGVRLYSDETHWTEVGFDVGKQEFYMDRTNSGAVLGKDFTGRTAAPLGPRRGTDVRLVVDRSSVEAFAQGGTIAMTDLVYPASTGAAKVKVVAFGGAVVTGEAWELRSGWQ